VCNCYCYIKLDNAQCVVGAGSYACPLLAYLALTAITATATDQAIMLLATDELLMSLWALFTNLNYL
jgi:hypothetical protein